MGWSRVRRNKGQRKDQDTATAVPVRNPKGVPPSERRQACVANSGRATAFTGGCD